MSKLDQRLQELEALVAGVNGNANIAQHPTLQGLHERLCKVEEDVNDLDAYVYEWTETAQTYLFAVRRVIEEKFDLKLRPYLDAVTAEKCGAKND